MGSRKGLRSALWPCLAVALALACTTPPPAPPGVEASVPDKAAYVIGPGDVLIIRVWKNPELSVEAPVRPDGKISVPLVDDVHAAGLTSLELKELLTAAMSEYVANPDITVVVQEIQSKRAYVLGSVARSGPVNLATEMRVLDAIAISGGFTEFADRDGVKVIRRTDGGDVEYRFDYDAYVSGKAPGSNILLQPGDTVVVPD